jgi:hypothetical protein
MSNPRRLRLAALGLCCWLGLDGGAPALDPNREKAAQEARQRLEKFAADVKAAKDPVELAAVALKDGSHGLALAALDVLADHWQDPRAVKALEQLADEGPHTLGDGLRTMAGEAYFRLLLVRARREVRDLLKGADKPEDKLARVRAVLAEHPTWLEPRQRPADKADVVRLLIEAAASAGDPAVDLLASSGLLTGAWAGQHGEAVLGYAKKLGRAKALTTPRLLEALVAAKVKGHVELLDAWLAEARQEDEIRELVSALAGLPDGQSRMLALLDDKRPAVLRFAVTRLRYSFPDEKSRQGVSAALQKRKQSGADETELRFLESALKGIEQAIADKKGE